MSSIQQTGEKGIRISVTLEDAVAMIQEAASNIPKYAHDIITIYEKMPVFEYVAFCFYAYDSSALFEFILDVDPKEYLSFSLDAPDSFFFALYGGMAALYPEAKKYI